MTQLEKEFERPQRYMEGLWFDSHSIECDFCTIINIWVLRLHKSSLNTKPTASGLTTAKSEKTSLVLLF